EARARLGLQLAELLAVAVRGEDGEPRLRVPERHLLAAEGDALGEQAVLEVVLALDERGRHDPSLARLAQPVQELAPVARRRLLRAPERVELLAAEEVAVAAHDLGLLRRLLLADANRSGLLGTLVEITREALLEFGRRPDRRDPHD